MWTHDDNFNLLQNINVRGAYKDGVLKYYNLYPVDGYVLHIPGGDYKEYDSEGNLIIDEPYYTWGGATELPGYDFATNPAGYEAIPYQEGMIVLGGVNPPSEKA